MDKLIIEKKTLRFTVEVTVQDNEVKVNIIRFIDVGKNESMSANAQLAKFDALRVNQGYLNCHDILHKVISCVEKSVPEHEKVTGKIILKKGQVFGCA
jgi:hypothetical protein